MPNKCSAILNALKTVILDKDQEIMLALACILARGHLLIEDLPGMGKTTLAKAFANVLGLECRRVQFTADMLPGDLIGASIYNEQTHAFEFKPGPVFASMLLADEINRGSPRVQSALLEVMAEHQVSVDSITYKLDEPFLVIATQNPLDQAGTFPLPESQLDRFMMRLELGFPARSEELRILRGENARKPPKAILESPQELLAMQDEVQNVHVAEPVLEYIMNLCVATRSDPQVPNPLSPRASLALLAASKACAYVQGRDFVTANDVQKVFAAVAEHRVRKGTVTLGATPCSDRILNAVSPII